MPRRKKIPAYRLHKASGQAVVALGGKTHYLGLYDSPESHKEYDRLVAEWLGRGGAAPPRRTGGYTMAEVAGAYLEHAKGWYVKDGKPTGQLERIERSVGIATGLYGDTPAADFGPLALKAVRQKMIDLGWTRVHVNHCVGCLVRVFKWAVSEELTPAEVYQALRTVEGLRKGRSPAREGAKVLPVPEEDLEPVISHCLPVVGDMARLQLLTGMRPGEVCQLRPCDVDRSGPVWVFRPGSHKTEHHEGSERVIFIGPRAQAVLAPYLLRAAKSYCFSPREAVARGGKRPWAGIRDRYDPKSYAHAIRNASFRYNRQCDELEAGVLRKGAKVELRRVGHWHPHRLRHNAATRVRAEFGPDVALAVLGHRSLDATQVYAELNLKKAAEAMAKIG